MWMQQWIDLQFEKLQQQAEQMMKTSNDMQLLAEETLCRIIQNTRACWAGEASKQLLEKELKLCGRLSMEASDLKKAAKIVEDCAKAMYYAEKCNETIGNFRMY